MKIVPQVVERANLEREALELLKELEGFLPVATWDVNALRNGYSTPCAPGERITHEEAERRALKALRKINKTLLSRYDCLTDRQAWALSLTAYNVGSFGAKLDAAARSADSDDLAAAMVLYVKSQGVKLEGLEARRAREVLFMNGV